LALEQNKPSYIRTTGTPIQKKIYENYCEINNDFNVMSEGDDALLISSGSITRNCIVALNELKESGKNIKHINLLKANPIPSRLLDEINNFKNVYVVEEHCSKNSLLDKLRATSLKDIKGINLGDKFHIVGDYEYLLMNSGLDADSIRKKILEYV